MGLLLRTMLAAAAALLVIPASGLAQTWDPPVALGASGLYAPPRGVLLGGGAYAVVYEDPALGIVVHTAAGDGTDFDTQVLDRSGSFPTVAADDEGEAIAAWDDPADGVQVSFGAAEGPFTQPVPIGWGAADGSRHSPTLAVSPLGWAAVAFDAIDDGDQRVYVAVRPPGGAFGPAQDVTPSTDDDPQTTASVAINDQGEVVVGYEQTNVAYAVQRTAGSDGAWQPPQVLGGPWAGLSASGLEVGIDANGGAVAVWDESGASGLPYVASVLAAFRPAGGVFAPPEGLIDTNDTEPFSLAVSAFGETILAVREVDPVTGELAPIVAISGSTVLGRFGTPSPVTSTWEEFDPTVAINARGDAVLTTRSNDTAELFARRRAPFGAFGPAAEIVPPPYAPIDNSDGIDRQITDVSLDQLGNAIVTWTDAADDAPIAVSLDGPLVTAVPGVSPPDPLTLAELVPAAVDASPGSGLPTAAPTAPVELPPPAIVADRPPASGGRLALVIEHAPTVTGTPRIVVAVRCPAACRAGLRAILITPSKHRLVLPAVAFTMDRGGVVSGSLRLSSAVRSALRTPAAGTANRYSTRHFELTVTATAGDAAGNPQTAVAKLAFVRR